MHGVASDADDSQHPSTDFKTDTDGSVNYFRAADAKAINDWKEKLGSFAAEHVIRPKLLSEGRACTFLILHFQLLLLTY